MVTVATPQCIRHILSASGSLALSVCVSLQIMESSQTLLHVLKRESVNLTKKKQASS